MTPLRLEGREHFAPQSAQHELELLGSGEGLRCAGGGWPWSRATLVRVPPKRSSSFEPPARGSGIPCIAGAGVRPSRSLERAAPADIDVGAAVLRRPPDPRACPSVPSVPRTRPPGPAAAAMARSRLSNRRGSAVSCLTFGPDMGNLPDAAIEQRAGFR